MMPHEKTGQSFNAKKKPAPPRFHEKYTGKMAETIATYWRKQVDTGKSVSCIHGPSTFLQNTKRWGF